MFSLMFNDIYCTDFFTVYTVSYKYVKNNNIAGDVINSVILSETEWNNHIGRKYF